MPDLDQDGDLVQQMISAAGIQRVIFVDDAFASGIDDLLELATGFAPEQLATLLGDPGGVELPQDVAADRIRTLWHSRDGDGQAALIDHAYAIDGGMDEAEPQALSVLSELFPRDACEQLSLKDWRERREGIIGELAAQPTLILFDKDFSHEGARDDEGPRLIVDLEAALEKLDPPVPAAFYGLLTNHAGVDTEHETRKEILAAHKVNPGRFVLISKQNLTPEPDRFVGRLRTVLFAPLFARLMKRVTTEVTAAHEAAESSASALPPEDLERMIIEGPADEGTWPPETALRIVQILQRSTAESALRSDPRVVQLNATLHAMSSVPVGLPDGAPASDLETAQPASTGDSDVDNAAPAEGSLPQIQPLKSASMGQPKPPVLTPEAIALAHLECYDSAAHVNELHLPVELGDIFSSGNKSYVVVSQPCDLMVRSGGKRQPELSHIVLAEVERGKPGYRGRFSTFELPWYDQSTGDSRFVNFDRRVSARATILDLCVLNANGESRIQPDLDEQLPLLPHWNDRQTKLNSQARSVLERCRKAQGKVEAGTLPYIAGWVKDDPFKPSLDISGGSISWSCTRTRRLREPYARALLVRASNYFARDAFHRDLVPRSIS